MGIDRREYMHEDRTARSVAGWWAVLPIADKLIALNVLLFVAWQVPALGRVMAEHFTFDLQGLLAGRVWTLLTATFSHPDLWNLVWNMLFLHWFGAELEHWYGKRNVLALFLGAGLVGSLAYALQQHLTGLPIPTFGAAGAVMGVVVVAALLFPQRTILFMWFIPMPLWLLALLKLGGDLLGVMGGGANGALLGGAAAGLAFKLLDLRPFPSPGQEGAEWDGAPWLGLAGWLGRRKARPRPLVRAGVPAGGGDVPTVDLDTDSQVDELLRKIHREGLASLSPEEDAFLRAASARYRRG